jgi:iron complex outermembrane receptor protein
MMILIAVPGFIQAQTLSTDTLKKMSLEELMDLEIVSVSKRSEKLSRAASAIQVITQEDIRHSGATNVPEALRLASNLQVAQVNSSQWAISARGFNNVLANKLLVLIDGRVVYTPMYAGVFWDVQNLLLEDVERIEVISGPGGTLWGANAVNGVINIITKSAQDTKGFFAEAAAGTTLNGLGSLRYGGKLTDNISYRIYGTAFKRGNVIYEDSIEVNDNWKMAQTGLRVDWDASEKDDIMLQMNVYGGRPDPDGDNPIIANGNNILARWNRIFSERSGLQFQAYYDKTWRDFRNDFTEALRTYDVEAQHRFTLGKRHELIYGFGFRYMDHEVENLELFAFRPARKSLYLYNVFLQDEITVVQDKLRVVLGLKLEHNSYTGYQHQPNARVNWTPTEKQALWAAASRAVRNPARIDREFYLSLAPGVDFIEGSNARSEEVLAYELGWRFQPVNSLSLSLATFYNIYDHIRSVEPGPPPFGIPLTFGNGVEGETYGVEFSATHQLSNTLRLRAGYTFLKKELRIKPDSEDMNEASAESNDPSHQFLLQSILNLPHGIEFGAVLRHVGKLPDPYVSDYTELDIRLAWRIIDALELNIVGQNLIQKSHTEFVPDTPYPKSIERSVYIKLVGRL